MERGARLDAVNWDEEKGWTQGLNQEVESTGLGGRTLGTLLHLPRMRRIKSKISRTKEE